MNIIEVFPSIFHLHFPTRFLLTSTFLRFQEHYESPEFRGKIFTLEEYKKWYISNSPKGKESGEFTYYQDWSGFNIPGTVLEPFFEGKFNPLTEQEQKILDTFRHLRGKAFYIIGTFGNRVPIDTLNHEIAHGFFSTNPHYKVEALQITHTLAPESRQALIVYLKSRGGYHESVFEDEIHAYLLTVFDKLLEKNIVKKEDRTVSLALWKLFENTKSSL